VLSIGPSRTLLSAVLIAFVAQVQARDVYINPKFPISGRDSGGRSSLSPPVIAVVDDCSTHVYVQSFIPKATIKVFLNGSTLIGTGTPPFAFGAITLTQPVHAGDHLTAIQIVNGLQSLPSTPATLVGALPAALPTPSVDPTIYACGHVVPVRDLISGVNVSASDTSAGGAQIGSAFTPNDWGTDWAPVVTSTLVGGHQITATQSTCTLPPSPPAAPQTVLADPSPLLAPRLDTPIIGNDAVTLHELYTGADVQTFDHANVIGSGFATGSDNWMRVAPIAATASISAQQSLCSAGPHSPAQTPSDSIPPPLLLGPICPAQSIVKVRNTTIDATLVLLKNGVVVGNGGAAPGDVPLSIAPPASFKVGDDVRVVEYIGSLVSPGSNVITVNCAAQNVVTQHNNNARQGAQLAEKTLTPANVTGTHFGLLYERHVLGTLLAQPLYVHGVKVRGQIKNVIFVATAEDVVYAFDADDRSADTTTNVPVRGAAVAESTKWLWRASLGRPHFGDICDETDPNIVGITSTPVIDVSASTMYVVARDDQQPGDGSLGHDYLHALDIRTGSDLRKVQVGATDPINGFVFNDRCQRQRPGLLLQNGNVYLGYATYSCDAGCPNGEPYRGWIIGFRATDFAAAGAFTNSKAYAEGGMGVWASGNGLAGTDDGSIFYQTGNDVSANLAPLGDSFVKLQAAAGALTQVSQYQPAAASNYKAGDTDLGAGGPMLLPNGKLIGGGKDGRFYVLSQADLTSAPTSFQAFYNTFHYGPGPYPYNSPAVYSTACVLPGVYGVANVGDPCYIDVNDYKNGEAYGPNIHTGPVFWGNASNHGFIYKMPEKDYLKAFEYDVASGAVNSTPAFVATVRPGADGMPGGFSSVSANGYRSGIVWTVVQQLNGMWGPPTPAILYAHNASNLTELWNNGATRTALAKFTAPTIADGRVVLPSFNLFQVYGLAPRKGPRPWLRHLPLDAVILAKWRSMGGAQGLLGSPTGRATHDGGGGVRQDFHTLVAGGGYGRISVPPSVTIAAPMCDAHVRYERNLPLEVSILVSERTEAHYIIGAIREAFLRSGGTARFGYPVTDEIPTPDGFGLMTRFQRDTIFWYPGQQPEIGSPKTPPRRQTPAQSQGPAAMQ
jgi:hypothetical protein